MLDIKSLHTPGKMTGFCDVKRMKPHKGSFSLTETAHSCFSDVTSTMQNYWFLKSSNDFDGWKTYQYLIINTIQVCTHFYNQIYSMFINKSNWKFCVCRINSVIPGRRYRFIYLFQLFCSIPATYFLAPMDHEVTYSMCLMDNAKCSLKETQREKKSDRKRVRETDGAVHISSYSGYSATLGGALAGFSIK